MLLLVRLVSGSLFPTTVFDAEWQQPILASINYFDENKNV